LVGVGPAPSAAGIIPFPIERKTLANGLEVVVVPTDHPGVVSYRTVVRTGSRNEVEPGATGFAHFFEHMMFRGTPTFPAEKFNATLKGIGADSNAFTTDDWTCYHITAASSALETIVKLESDRFRNLQYPEPAFQKEARAVLGEYNKNSSNPVRLLFEKMVGAAFTTHTYRHTTMGFLADIEKMPEKYEYSRTFFDRYYRPENCVVLVVGDVRPDQAFDLVQRYYASWERGSWKNAIPSEPEQTSERQLRVPWPTPTEPHLAIGWKTPAYDPASKESAVLPLLATLAFGETSPFYRKVVLEEDLADLVWAEAEPHRDPNLLVLLVRLKSKDPKAMVRVRSEIEKTLGELRSKPLDVRRVAEAKSALRYGVAMRMDTPDGVAEALAEAIELTGDAGSLETFHRTLAGIRSADVQAGAKRIFVDAKRTVVVLEEEVGK
jgi:zinc protease